MLEIYFGPMKSGKSLRLLNTAFDLKSRGVSYLAIKPSLDTRDGKFIYSRGREQKVSAVKVRTTTNIVPLIIKHKVKNLLIDEIMLFDSGIVAVLAYCRIENIDVYAAGLDLDFRRKSFVLPSPKGQDYTLDMADIIAEFDLKTQLTATCDVCGKTALYTQRLFAGKPAPDDSPVVQVGDDEYEPRCGACYIGQKI